MVSVLQFGFETDVDADVDVDYDVGSDYHHFCSISIGFDLMVSLVLFLITTRLLWPMLVSFGMGIILESYYWNHI